MDAKKRGGQPGAKSITGKTIEAMQPGDTVTFTYDANVYDAAQCSKLTHTVGSYAVRKHPGASFTYETFEAVTARRRHIVGLILTFKE